MGVKRKTGSNVDIDPHSLSVWKYRRGGGRNCASVEATWGEG